MDGIVWYARHRDRLAKEELKNRVTMESTLNIVQTYNSGCLLYFKHLVHYYLDMVKCVVLTDMGLFVLFF